MSIEKVKKYFNKYNMEDKVLEFKVSSATVELAAQALNVEPARIAKTLSFKQGDDCVLIVCAGDVRIDNKKYKSYFHTKARMLSPEEVFKATGHMIGGVCPFGIDDSIKVYTDISLKRFNTVFPACGSSNSAIELNCDELFKYSSSLGWVDVCS